MTTKFKIGDKVQQITNSTNYFAVSKIIIDNTGIWYSPNADSLKLWSENELQIKKEKVKKYKYAFLDFNGKPVISEAYYLNDFVFAGINPHILVHEYQKLDFTEKEFDV